MEIASVFYHVGTALRHPMRLCSVGRVGRVGRQADSGHTGFRGCHSLVNCWSEPDTGLVIGILCCQLKTDHVTGHHDSARQRPLEACREIAETPLFMRNMVRQAFPKATSDWN